MAARGAPTMANSAATKIPFRRMSTAMMRKAVTRAASGASAGRPTMTDAMCPASTTSISTSSPSMLTLLSRFGEAAEHCDDVRRDGLVAAAPAADDRGGLIEPHRAGQPHPAVGQEDGAKLRRP